VRTIGLLGGMSWESSATYYRLINQDVAARLGGYHSARLVLVSVDFAEIEEQQRAGAWEEAARALGAAGKRCVDAGAEILGLATNTMHLVADEIEGTAGIPLLHIADAAAGAIHGAGLRRVGLLGTRFTMERPFYAERLQRAGLEVVVPEANDRELVDRIIFEELVHGTTRDASRKAYRAVIARLADVGAEGIVLGCTEIGLLMGSGDSDLPLFDTTAIHARALVDAALE
jgi:aspartate racemase